MSKRKRIRPFEWALVPPGLAAISYAIWWTLHAGIGALNSLGNQSAISSGIFSVVNFFISVSAILLYHTFTADDFDQLCRHRDLRIAQRYRVSRVLTMAIWAAAIVVGTPTQRKWLTIFGLLCALVFFSRHSKKYFRAQAI